MEFHETKEGTQKEIVEILLKENYLPKKDVSGKFNDTFDLFRIMSIKQILASKRLPEEIKSNEEKKEREFTDKKSIDFMLGKKEFQQTNFKQIKYQKKEAREIKGSDRDIINKFKEDEQGYLNAKTKNDLALVQAIIDLGNNYEIKLYQ